MEREELITSTITTVPPHGLGQLCRYSRSEGWPGLYAWDWDFPRPVRQTSSSVIPMFLLRAAIKRHGKRRFLSFSLCSFSSFPTLLYVFLLLSGFLFVSLD